MRITIQWKMFAGEKHWQISSSKIYEIFNIRIFMWNNVSWLKYFCPTNEHSNDKTLLLYHQQVLLLY